VSYTPMMLQYLSIKEQYKDCILLYRVGDFYETYFDDAEIASKDMEIVLTHKGCGDGEITAMCGVPYHALETYIVRLIDKGHKVAIAEQMEDPALAKGIVKREVIRVITPGTVLNQGILKDKENNYLASVFFSEEGIAVSWSDISTGEFSALELKGDNLTDQLLAQITRIDPKEIITNKDENEATELWRQAQIVDKLFISIPGGDLYSERNCQDIICSHFNTTSTKSAGLAIEDVPTMFFAVGGLLGYLKQTQKQDLKHLTHLNICQMSDSMSLDKATIKNLEITETLFEHNVKGSLLGVLDKTKSAMGGRMMKQWLREPLNNKKEIEKRLDAVENLTDDVLVRNNIKASMNGIYDLERLCTRVALGTANARDMIALKSSLESIPEIKADIESLNSSLLKDINSRINPLNELKEHIDKAIIDEPPFSIREGNIIKDGYSSDLDIIKDSVKDSRLWIAGLEQSEKNRTGIKNLKVGYNKVFGYYIEVSKGQTDLVPENYIRKQTLVNGERYITPELKNAENIVLNAQVKINELEYKLFNELRLFAYDLTQELQATAHALAELDVLVSFADSAVNNNYVRPVITEKDEIKILKGRHPVIEQTIRDGVYVSNDIYLNRKDASMLLITGPNMAGKSTYMRQLALIVLMAQSGSFVPASEAEIGICDRIYTRIGASDNIAMGQSTFYVEMSELAYILNTASEKSLIILDEIGRGTSTYDGLSIAWAVVENLCSKERHIRTLFATHYHELTALSNQIKGVKNLNVDVSEDDGNVVFLHKIVEGSASRSYGIHVARLAGVPKSVLETAQNKLNSLENSDNPVNIKDSEAKVKSAEDDSVQISMFNFKDSEIAAKIRNLDLMNVTPSGAIKILEELKEAAENE